MKFNLNKVTYHLISEAFQKLIYSNNPNRSHTILDKYDVEPITTKFIEILIECAGRILGILCQKKQSWITEYKIINNKVNIEIKKVRGNII